MSKVKCEACGSSNTVEYHGSMEMEHIESGIETDVEINGHECKDCGEVTVSEEEAERIFTHLKSLTDKAENEIDLDMYR